MQKCFTSTPPPKAFHSQPTHQPSPRSTPTHILPPEQLNQCVSTALSQSMASKNVKQHRSSYSSTAVPVSGPGTPSRGSQQPHGSTQPLELGQTSVVTFSYIEKANVQQLESPHNFLRTQRKASQPHKNDLAFSVSSGPCSNNSPFHQQAGSPALNQVTVGCGVTVGQAATQRALEDFGSKFAHGSDWNPGQKHNQQVQCQSWAGSPGHDTYSHNYDTERPSGPSSIPASHCSSSHTGNSNLPLEQTSSPRVQKDPNLHQLTHEDTSSGVDGSPLSGQKGNLLITNAHSEGLNQLSGSNTSSALNSPEVARRLALEATKISVIFDDIRKSPAHNAFGVQSELGSPKQSQNCPSQHRSPPMKMNIPLQGMHSELSVTNEATICSQAAESLANHSPERGEQTNYFCSPIPLGQAPDSPALPSHAICPWLSKGDKDSPLRDPRAIWGDLSCTDSPTLHRRRLPQYTGEVWKHQDTWDLYPHGHSKTTDEPASDSEEISRRLLIGQHIEETPVSWTFMQRWREHNGNEIEMLSPVQRSEESKTAVEDQGVAVGTDLLTGQDTVTLTLEQKQAEWKRRQALLLGPVVLDEENDERAEVEQNGVPTSSPSSSGVTGSLGDHECFSPEASSNSNQTEHASSGIQVRQGCDVYTPYQPS